jgi:hypothetical protein
MRGVIFIGMVTGPILSYHPEWGTIPAASGAWGCGGAGSPEKKCL